MTILDAILAVFTAIGDWIGTAFSTVMAIFYTAPVEGVGGGLTYIGVLTICGLAFAIFFLVLNYIKDFMRFR